MLSASGKLAAIALPAALFLIAVMQPRQYERDLIAVFDQFDFDLTTDAVQLHLMLQNPRVQGTRDGWRRAGVGVSDARCRCAAEAHERNAKRCARPTACVLARAHEPHAAAGESQ